MKPFDWSRAKLEFGKVDGASLGDAVKLREVKWLLCKQSNK